MPMKRRAYIEFNSQDHIQITTSVFQKSFNLKEKDEYAIDRISLNPPKVYKPTKPPSDFFAVIRKVNFDPDDYDVDYEPEEIELVDFYLEVWAKTAIKNFDIIGTSHLGSKNNINHKVTIR